MSFRKKPNRVAIFKKFVTIRVIFLYIIKLYSEKLSMRRQPRRPGIPNRYFKSLVIMPPFLAMLAFFQVLWQHFEFNKRKGVLQIYFANFCSLRVIAFQA